MEHKEMTDEQLEKWAAENVMGWEYIIVGYYGTDDETERMRELKVWFDRVGIDSVGHYYINVKNDFWIPEVEWNPPTDLNQAFMVVKKMREDGYSLLRLTQIPKDESDNFEAIFYLDKSTSAKTWGAFDKNPARAILMAAREAVAGKI